MTTTSPPDPVAPRFAPRPKVDPRWVRLAWPLLSLVGLLVFDLLFVEGFFHVDRDAGPLTGTVVDILERVSPILILAVGMTLVIATGGVDLSVGSVMAMCAATAANVAAAGHPPAVAFAAAMGVGLLAGAWNGALVAVLRIQPIVATLILMVAGRGIAQLLGQNVEIKDATYLFLGTGRFLWLPFSVTLVVVLLVGTALVVRKTALGLFIEAVGGNASASRYAGVNATAVKWLVYVFSGGCACVAGLVESADKTVVDSSNLGNNMELDAILAVVIGGTALTGGRFSLPGTVIGALVIQTLTTTLLMKNVAPDRTLAVRAAVVIAVCLLQSEALRVWFARLRGKGRA
jgi:simple sugar transport system permease protein